MSDDALVFAVARKRMLEAEETGAELLVTACQQCKRTLKAAGRQENLDMGVVDVVELIARQVEKKL